MTNLVPLDNPVWSALTTVHRPMAIAHGMAARYPADISPLAGMREPTAEAFADLRSLVAAGEAVWLLTTCPLDAPSGWKILRERFIDQMVCDNPLTEATEASDDAVELVDRDVADMVALAAKTEPGPFLPKTIRMGRYAGVRNTSGELIAMAGERMNAESFTEISAVCTDPGHRGKGLAKSLVIAFAARLQSEGKLPMLHVKTENGAKVVYEKIGFVVRRQVRFTVLTPQ